MHFSSVRWRQNLTSKWEFVGIDNYLSLIKDGSFIKQLSCNIYFYDHCCTGTSGGRHDFRPCNEQKETWNIGIANHLDHSMAAAGCVVALLFKWIFNANYGVFNNILIKLGILEKNQAWLSTGNAMLILGLVCIWKGYALIMVNVMAGLQSVPEDVYEAAKLDGAKPAQTFFKITLPMIKPVIATAVILDIVWWFKHYTIIKLLTDGGPNNLTSTVSITIYKEAFSYHNYGPAAAEAGVVFVICWLISKVMRRLMDSDA